MTASWETPNQEFDDPAGDSFESEEFVAEIPSFARTSRRRPAILLATVVSGSLVAIVVMRTLTGGLGQVMADTGIDEAVSGLLDFVRDGKAQEPATQEAQGDPFADLITDHYAAMQIPPDQLRANPFVTPWTVTNQSTAVNHRVPLSPSQQRTLRREELMACSHLILVESVMTGNTPLATINDQVLGIGDEIYLEEEDATCSLQAVTADGVIMKALDEDLGLHVSLTIPLRRD